MGNRILIGIGKFILGLGIVMLGAAFVFRGMALTQNTLLLFLVYLGIPILFAVTRKFWRGLIYMLLVCVLVNASIPLLGLSYGSPIPGVYSKQEDNYFRNGDTHVQRKDSSTTIEGTYSGNIGGAIATMVVSSDAWYGEHREEATGEILGSSVGTMDGYDVIDEYGNRIGYVKNGYARVTIGDVNVTLERE
jgi:hypothetical protein